MIISKTISKILQVGLYWPIIFRDMHIFTTECDRCQRTKNISSRDEMTQNHILEVEIFDVWGIYFIRPFPSSNGNKSIVSPTNDAQVVINMF